MARKLDDELSSAWLFIDVNDEYELPVFVSSNVSEIEKHFKKSFNNILNSLRRGNNIIDKYTRKRLKVVQVHKEEK